MISLVWYLYNTTKYVDEVCQYKVNCSLFIISCQPCFGGQSHDMVGGAIVDGCASLDQCCPPNAVATDSCLCLTVYDILCCMLAIVVLDPL